MSDPPSVAPRRGAPAGLFLAIDTAGAEGSVAIGHRSGVSHRQPETRLEILAGTTLRPDEEHASLLLPRVQDLLGEVGAGVGDLSGVVVGSGPGSFTGVRVGAATAKGLAWALNLPLWAFSSLAAAAADVDDDPFRPRLVLFDARGDRVYAAAYRVARGSMDTLLAPRATTVGEVLDELLPPGALLMGDGALKHQALLQGAGNLVLPPPAGRPSARGLLRLLSLDAEAAPLDDLGRWEPDYLRESGAERMWKTRTGWEGP
ncbi:MAG: tRNA (adenosine(37)-N6)-threonylcarbamoyltransferase complex dimerization subunit type 1 TsaB [Gemmatimonadota bacterium]